MVKLCLKSNSSDALFVSCSCILLTTYGLCASNASIFPSNTMLHSNVSLICRISLYAKCYVCGRHFLPLLANTLYMNYLFLQI